MIGAAREGYFLADTAFEEQRDDAIKKLRRDVAESADRHRVLRNARAERGELCPNLFLATRPGRRTRRRPVRRAVLEQACRVVDASHLAIDFNQMTAQPI